jgi:ring-1,2-phenylacetyl-CoA epoxidase subunit PaaC
MSDSALTKDVSFRQEYLLRLADNCLILGQRLGEWCGHGPVLEQDIALTNIALDLIGQARSWLTLTGKTYSPVRTEDELAFQRDAWDFRNLLLVEQPNGDFAHTIVRQFFFDAFHFLQLQRLEKSQDEDIAAIAAKSLKEVTYHLRYSSEWMIRLGDGTPESHERMQNAVDDLWMFTGEMLSTDEVETEADRTGIGFPPTDLKKSWFSRIEKILDEATLRIPEEKWMQSGGKQGRHSEHMGFILSDMQFLQRAYPGMTW